MFIGHISHSGFRIQHTDTISPIIQTIQNSRFRVQLCRVIFQIVIPQIHRGLGFLGDIPFLFPSGIRPRYPDICIHSCIVSHYANHGIKQVALHLNPFIFVFSGLFYLQPFIQRHCGILHI